MTAKPMSDIDLADMSGPADIDIEKVDDRDRMVVLKFSSGYGTFSCYLFDSDDAREFADRLEDAADWLEGS